VTYDGFRWALLVLLGWIAACGGEAPPPAPLPPTLAELAANDGVEVPATGEVAPHAPVAFVLGDRADLDPCACPEGVVGGHARRTSLLRRLSEEFGTLPFAVGPGSLAPSTRQEVRAAPKETAIALSEIYALAGAEVIALGAADVALLSPDDLSVLARETDVPLIATNLSGPASGGPGKIATLQALTGTLAVLSLIDPAGGPLTASGYQVHEPGVAVADALAGISADAVIAFSDASPRRLPELARGLDGVDFLIGTAGNDGRSEVENQRGAHLIFVEPGSLRVGLLDLVFAGGELGGFEDDAHLRGVIDQRLLTVARRVRTSLTADPVGAAGDASEVDAQRLRDLDAQLTTGVVDRHVFGFQALPVLLEYPQAADALEAVQRFKGR